MVPTRGVARAVPVDSWVAAVLPLPAGEAGAAEVEETGECEDVSEKALTEVLEAAGVDVETPLPPGVAATDCVPETAGVAE